MYQITVGQSGRGDLVVVTNILIIPTGFCSSAPLSFTKLYRDIQLILKLCSQQVHSHSCFWLQRAAVLV